MLKSEFVSSIAAKTGLPKKDVLAAVDAYHETVIEALSRGESIPLQGFGTFSAVTVSSMARKDSDVTAVRSLISPRFSPSKRVKDALNLTDSP